MGVNDFAVNGQISGVNGREEGLGAGAGRLKSNKRGPANLECWPSEGDVGVCNISGQGYHAVEPPSMTESC